MVLLRDFFYNTMDSGRGARALVRFWHTHANMRWLRRALLPAAHVAPTVSLLRTPIVDSSVSKKRHQRATLPASADFFYRAAAPQSPCALRGCCPSRQRLTGSPTIICFISTDDDAKIYNSKQNGLCCGRSGRTSKAGI